MSLNLPTNSSQAPMAHGRLALWFAVLTLLGIWPALSNGQPLFFPDTTAYVRGADVAIAKALGDRFATDWAKDQRRVVGIQTSIKGSDPSSPEGQPAERPVIAGRSIIYGALLYLGALTGGMWLSIIAQSLVGVYLVYLFTVRTVGLDFRCFLVCCGALLLASPLPFFVSFLMPDVFAGFLILGFAILATGWDRLSHTERAMASAVLLFAVLAHPSHVILLIGLTALLAARSLTESARWVRIRGLVGIAAACVLLAMLWEATFSFAVSRAVGAPPLLPPHVTAKLVSMLGESAVSQACAANDFAVCKFRDRFPTDSDTFLWSEDKRTGVFNVADMQTRRALSKEQMRFALAVIPPNLGRVVCSVFQDGLRQLTTIGLGEYRYDATRLDFFKNRLPSRDFARMASSVAARSRIYVIFGRRLSYSTAALGLAVIVLLLSGALRPAGVTRETKTTRENVWRAATYLPLAGIVLNAFICGGLSSVNDRYEARVIWLIQLSLITGIYVLRPQVKLVSLFKSKLGRKIAVVQG